MTPVACLDPRTISNRSSHDQIVRKVILDRFSTKKKQLKAIELQTEPGTNEGC